MMFPRKDGKDGVTFPDSLMFFDWIELFSPFLRVAAFNAAGTQGEILDKLRSASYAKDTMVKK